MSVDDPLSMDANYRFGTADRRYIDDQIRGVQQRVDDLEAAVEELGEGGGGGGGDTSEDEIVWTPTTSPATEVHSEAFELVHDGSPSDQEVFSVEVPDAYSTSHKVIVQCAGPNAQFFYREWKATWMRDGTLVQVKDAASSSGDASGNEAGYSATLALDGTAAVLTATGEGTWSAILTRMRTANGAAPILLSVTSDVGDTAGGESVTLAGARFATGVQVTFGGTPATGEILGTQNSLVCTTPAHAGGDVDVVVLNLDGKSATLAAGYTYASAFDPLAENPVLYVKGPYAGPPWNDESPEGNDLVTGGANPPAGVALNGIAPADFIPTDFLVTSANNNAIYPNNGLTIGIFFYARTVPTASGVDYQDGNLLGDATNGETTIGNVDEGGTDKAIACFYAGAFKRVEATCAAGAWHLIWVTHDPGGTGDLSISVDGSTPAGAAVIACGNISFLVPGPLRVGHSYAGSVQHDGYIMEIVVYDAVKSSTVRDDYRGYLNATYGVSV